MTYFRIEEIEGQTVQKCTRCSYVSPIITNGHPERISHGMRQHYKLTHSTVISSEKEETGQAKGIHPSCLATHIPKGIALENESGN